MKDPTVQVPEGCALSEPILMKAYKDPTGKDLHEPGAKADSGKAFASLLLDFSRALASVAQVSTMGAKKYSRGGWQHVPEGITRYKDAMMRHLLAMNSGEVTDKESGFPHSWHFTWNVLAVLELEQREMESKSNENPSPV